jgi:hypothetical protein
MFGDTHVGLVGRGSGLLLRRLADSLGDTFGLCHVVADGPGVGPQS